MNLNLSNAISSSPCGPSHPYLFERILATTRWVTVSRSEARIGIRSAERRNIAVDTEGSADGRRTALSFFGVQYYGVQSEEGEPIVGC